jgi:hypothetical protein
MYNVLELKFAIWPEFMKIAKIKNLWKCHTPNPDGPVGALGGNTGPEGIPAPNSGILFYIQVFTSPPPPLRWLRGAAS